MEEKWERKAKGSNSWCSDGRKSLVRELKLVYSTRAISRCQIIKKVGFSPKSIPLNLRAVNDRVVQPRPWDSVFRRWDYFSGQFWGKFEDCFMDEFIAVNDSLEICKKNKKK